MALGAQAGAGPGGPRPLLVADPEAKPATEFLDLLQDLARVLQPPVANPPGPGRKRRMLTTVLLPGGDAPASS